MSKPALKRCAVYTRKSSEEGLEQDFNSLHAQREACEAFIKSQIGEGWKLVPTAYDDGGISGGTMDRPGLKRLLADIALGKIDVIVVYKVDRLTRALSDFAKMVEVFDAHGVSFVAVTQQFNTTTSMGRLTLNVLLSFAQFEREVTGERIRDKIAASKKKGMWMGGSVPLGYAVVERKLIIVPAEAEFVREIYETYLKLRSITVLRHQLNIASKLARAQQRPSDSTPPTAGRHRIFSRGALYALLRNPIYIGEIRHKEERHPGLHDPILPKALWDEVQQGLIDQAATLRGSSRMSEPSVLIGKLWDERGGRLRPSHTIKDKVRYRYYVSPSDGPESLSARWRLPAPPLEAAIAIGVRTLLSDQAAIVRAAESVGLESNDLPDVLLAAKIQLDKLESLGDFQARKDALALVKKAELQSDGINLTIRLLVTASEHPQPIEILGHVLMKLKRRGVEMRLVLQGGAAPERKPDETLIKSIGRGCRWFEELTTGQSKSATEIAGREGVTDRYVAHLMQLAFLSPEIVTSIVEGTQPAELSATKLIHELDLDLDWSKQCASLGFQA